MSPDEDLPPSSVAIDNMSDDPLTAEEQAQFDAMRGGDDGDPPPPPQPDPPADPDPPAPPLKAGEKPPAPPVEDTDPDVEVTDPKTGTKQKRVSIHKYQRLEERAKAAEEERTKIANERQELLDRFSRADERLKIISEAMATPEGQQQQQQEDPDPAPDPEKDIFGYAQWQGRQIVKLNERLNGIEQGAVEQTNETEIANTYRADAGRFAAAEPAFAEAYVYLIQQRDRELELAGVTDKRARDQQIVREEKGLVAGAIKAGRSPAEMIFKMAQGRGYTKTAAPPVTNGNAAPPAKDPKALDAPVNGGAQPPQRQAAPPQQQQKPTITEEIEAIKRGQEAAVSLSNVGGGAPVQELTSAALADMSEEEFNKLIERLPRERVMELMGN